MDIHKEPISCTELLQIMDTHNMDDILDEGNNEKKKKEKEKAIYSQLFLPEDVTERRSLALCYTLIQWCHPQTYLLPT